MTPKFAPNGFVVASRHHSWANSASANAMPKSVQAICWLHAENFINNTHHRCADSTDNYIRKPSRFIIFSPVMKLVATNKPFAKKHSQKLKQQVINSFCWSTAKSEHFGSCNTMPSLSVAAWCRKQQKRKSFSCELFIEITNATRLLW